MIRLINQERDSLLNHQGNILRKMSIFENLIHRSETNQRICYFDISFNED